MGRDPELQNRQWRAIRRAVLVRDRYTCYVCLGRANSVDHVIPRSMGGSHHLDNLRACCSKCNSTKGERAPAVPIPSRVW
jgi:5-methylcytosine-specific restriction endonuclease McrA